MKKRSVRSIHRFRVATKKYRGALEVAVAVFQANVMRRIRAVESLNDLLVRLHDVEEMVNYLIETNRRFARDDKSLAKSIELMLNVFEAEHKARRADFRAFLAERQPWDKKVKLTVASA